MCRRPDCIEVDRDVAILMRNPTHIREGLSRAFVSTFIHAGQISDPFLTDTEAVISCGSHQDDQKFELVSMLAAQSVEHASHQFLRQFIVVAIAKSLLESIVYQ